MRVLILIESATIGGHVLSALTTAGELQNRGHEVEVASGQGELRPTIPERFRYHEVPFHHFHKRRQTNFTLRSFETVRALAGIVSAGKYDIIHAFDTRSYIVATMLDLLVSPISVACTICGGVAPYNNIPRSNNLIVFSEEQKNRMIHTYGWREEDVVVIRSRLDMEQFTISDNEVHQVCMEFGIDPSFNNIMMVTTFLGPKVRPVQNVLRAMRSVLGANPHYRFIMIGAKGEFYGKAREIGAGINMELQRDAIVFTGLVPGAYRFLKNASIVLGQGRSAFEGMAFGKPTLIVGDNGYAGTVCDRDIEDLAYYNFSGRNMSSMVPAERMAEEINRLIRDREYRDRVGRFGRDYVYRHINIKAGIPDIEKVYERNIEYSRLGSRPKRMLNLMRVTAPILFDNYYNMLKSLVMGK